GYIVAVAVSLFAIARAMRVLGQASPTGLLAGQTVPADRPALDRPPRWSRRLAWGSAVGAVVLLGAGGVVSDHEAQARCLLGGGARLLTAGLAGVWLLLRRVGSGDYAHAERLRLGTLGLRNASRHPTRSLLTAGLLAASAFLIVAVESFRREPDRAFLNR